MKKKTTGTTRKKMRRNGKLFGMVPKMCGKFPSSKISKILKFLSSQVPKFPSCQVAKLRRETRRL